MCACVVEEGRDEGGGEECAMTAGPADVERPRREVLLSARGRRACSEQGPHPGQLLRSTRGCARVDIKLIFFYFVYPLIRSQPDHFPVFDSEPDTAVDTNSFHS
ncbi:hypothetical protein EVAR_95033_1 [Eumeta japonica]|uniref:Uncharacterized protein n=1 Tax=Eumeta variegata TaxID=151549 RepID=A0A4C1VVW0_EUMVA|nr:hypothetical protein EVAR_95033_1 [Eumeta japonica]